MGYPRYWSSDGCEWNRGKVDDLRSFLKRHGFYSNGIQGDRAHVPGVGSAYYFELNYPHVPFIFAVGITPLGHEAIWTEYPRGTFMYWTQSKDVLGVPMKIQILDALKGILTKLNEVTNAV